MMTAYRETPSPGPSANADMRRRREGKGGGSGASDGRQFSLAAPTPTLPRIGGGRVLRKIEA